jgi:hypothetical protein
MEHRKGFLVIRKASLMEDEGHAHIVAMYGTRDAAEKWIGEQTDYFKPADYFVQEVEMWI